MLPRSPALYFDDIEVGLRFTTGSHRVDEAEIIDFARRFDPQPFHTDPQAALGSVFAGLAWLAVSSLFSWYLGNFANYNATYGALGAVVGLMM